MNKFLFIRMAVALTRYEGNFVGYIAIQQAILAFLDPFLPIVAFSQFQHLLSERLTSLGIMRTPRVPPLNPSETIVL